METLGYVLVLVGGLIHIYIFYIEALAWRSSYHMFGVRSEAEAEVMHNVMFNQGFYNLFVALGAIGGSWLGLSGRSVGNTLALYAAAFMFGAALVLLSTDNRLIRPAAIQGLLPAVGFVLLLIA